MTTNGVIMSSLKDYFKKIIGRTKKPKEELTTTDKVILDYINTKNKIDSEIKKARNLERKMSKYVNKDGVLSGRVYTYKETPYTVRNAPRLEDLDKAGLTDMLDSKGLIRSQKKTKRDYGKLQ